MFLVVLNFAYYYYFSNVRAYACLIWAEAQTISQALFDRFPYYPHFYLCARFLYKKEGFLANFSETEIFLRLCLQKAERYT